MRLRPLLIVLVSLAASASLSAQTGPTLEWIYSDAGRAVSRMPERAWLGDGSLLLYDGRRLPAATRAFERVDPATGTRRPLFEMAKAVASVQALAPAAGVRDALGWPDAIDPAGTHLFYLFDHDVFVLDVAAAAFTRLTKTDAPEQNLSVSPDGRRVAFVRGRNLYSVEVATAAETTLTADGSETTLNGTLSWVYWEEIFGRRDTAYWWSPDGRAIAYLQTDDSPVAVSHFVDFQPATPRVIEQRYPKAGGANPLVRVGIVSASGGSTRWVRIDDAPFEWVLRVGWLPGGARVSVQTLTRDQQTLGLYFADAATGQATRVLTETDPGWINVGDDLRFLSNGRGFLWSSERTGYRHLYRYTLDGTLANAVTSGDWALTSADQSVYWVTRAVAGVDEQAGWVYVASLRGSSVERQLWRARLDGTGMVRVSAEPGTHNISMSPDARFYVDARSDIRTLPSLSLRRADGSLVAELAPAQTDAIAVFGMTYPELTTIPASDGFRLPAQVLRPAGTAPGARLPVILYVYGGPSAPTVIDQWQDLTFYAQLLARAGYAVVQIDNRSATATSKRLENTILRSSGGPETADLVDAVRWLKEQPWVDPARIGVWGWSGGGTMTLNLMTRSEEFKAGISVAPVTDWRFYDSKWAEAFMKRPEDNPQGYADFDLVARAPHLHGRLLLVYGTYDDNVHPQNEQAFADALIRAGILFDTMIYPMRKHGIGDDPARIHLFRTMIEFWKKSL